MTGAWRNAGRARFRISHELLREHPEKVADLLSGLVVTRAESCFASCEISYLALHPSFPETQEGRECPELKVVRHPSGLGGPNGFTLHLQGADL